MIIDPPKKNLQGAGCTLLPSAPPRVGPVLLPADLGTEPISSSHAHRIRHLHYLCSSDESEHFVDPGRTADPWLSRKQDLSGFFLSLALTPGRRSWLSKTTPPGFPRLHLPSQSFTAERGRGVNTRVASPQLRSPSSAEVGSFVGLM